MPVEEDGTLKRDESDRLRFFFAGSARVATEEEEEAATAVASEGSASVTMVASSLALRLEGEGVVSEVESSLTSRGERPSEQKGKKKKKKEEKKRKERVRAYWSGGDAGMLLGVAGGVTWVEVGRLRDEKGRRKGKMSRR